MGRTFSSRRNARPALEPLEPRLLLAGYDDPPPLPPPIPADTITVSSVSQLISAVGSLQSGKTISLAAGTYNLSGVTDALYVPQGITNWSIRGATGDRDDVVIKGAGMSGSVRFGLWMMNSPNGTIADLTIDGVSEHGLIVNPGAHNLLVHNVRIVDSGHQFVKSNPAAGEGNDNGIVEYSVFEYRTTDNDDYSNGVDVHTGDGWIVRYNLFKNFLNPPGSGIAGPAVLMWNESSNSVIEGNTFINCARGISLGLIDRAGGFDHQGGTIRNNILYRDTGIASDVDVPIYVADSPNTTVYHNTVISRGTYPSAVEYRFASTTGLQIKNNLTDGAITARDGASATVSGNKTNATLSLFVNATAGDLHLASTATSAINQGVAISGFTLDFDGQTRDSQLDLGADEYVASGDTTAPIISGVGSSSVGTAGATISWTTDEASNTQIEYGTTTSYGSSTTLDAALVTSHSQTISGLNPSTTYHYRVKSRDGAGNLAVSGDFTFTTTTPASTDWGTIDFAQHNNLDITGSETWYRFTAARTGKGTVDLAFSNAAGNVNLQVFNASFASLGASNSSTNAERVDFDATGGGVYYVKISGSNSDVDARVTNLVNVSGTTVNVFGTAGSDAFSFTHGTSHQVTVKGVTYTYTPAQLGTLNISGGGASDTLTVALGSLNDTVTLRPGEVTVTNSDYSVSGTSLEAISVAAGAGADLASLYDAASDDTLTASPASARFAGTDFDNTASGFDEVRAYATAGGFDVANLTDGATNDFFDAGPASAVLRGPAFFIRGEAFDQYKALATGGGSDRANLYDGGGNDFFDAGPSSGLLRGASFYSYAERFESLNGYATTGGIDQARLYDSAGNDFFDAGPHSAVLRGSSFYSYVERFDKVFAYAQWGGTDVAKLYDGGGNDFFDAGPTSGLMQGNGWYNWADRFEEVMAFATSGGNDTANLYGSIGNDLFTTTSNVGRLAGTNYSLRAEQFEQSNVRLHQGGADLAEFRDFLTADLLFGNANLARGTVSGKQTSVFDMDEVDAYAASGQSPTSNLSAIDYLYEEIGTWL